MKFKFCRANELRTNICARARSLGPQANVPMSCHSNCFLEILSEFKFGPFWGPLSNSFRRLLLSRMHDVNWFGSFSFYLHWVCLLLHCLLLAVLIIIRCMVSIRFGSMWKFITIQLCFCVEIFQILNRICFSVWPVNWNEIGLIMEASILNEAHKQATKLSNKQTNKLAFKSVLAPTLVPERTWLTTNATSQLDAQHSNASKSQMSLCAIDFLINHYDSASQIDENRFDDWIESFVANSIYLTVCLRGFRSVDAANRL